MQCKKFIVVTSIIVLVAATTAWRVAAQVQSANAATSLAQWQYPDGSGYGAQLVTLNFPDLPYGGLQGKTDDPIEKVYAFYRGKVTLGLAASRGFNWQNNTDTTLLVNQPADGGTGLSAMYVPRQASDSAMLIAHQPTQTVIIKLSRDAQDRSETDIAIVVDKH